MAYCCDLTIAADHSIFSQNGPRVASPTGGYPVSHLAGIIGHKRAREMWMLHGFRPARSDRQPFRDFFNKGALVRFAEKRPL
jgi:1,4-dihydroxy-2-naphthoyl-CoA synthase